MTYTTRFQSTSQILVGSAILLMGTALLFDNLNVIEVGALWKHWPILVVAFGLGKLLQAETPAERGKGIWWIFLGAWLYVSTFKLLGFGFRGSWPILLIGWGVSMVWKSLIPQSTGIEKENHHE